VVEFAHVAPAGHIARFDNDVYFQAIRGTVYGLGYLLHAQFTLFLSPDHTPVRPPMEVISRALAIRHGYDFESLGGIFGIGTARASLRRVREQLGARTGVMTRWYAKPRAHFEPDAPQSWVTARFMIRPRGVSGSKGYDWEVIGRGILGSLDDVRVLLGTEYSR
jgi:hypothetical protein